MTASVSLARVIKALIGVCELPAIQWRISLSLLVTCSVKIALNVSASVFLDMLRSSFLVIVFFKTFTFFVFTCVFTLRFSYFSSLPLVPFLCCRFSLICLRMRWSIWSCRRSRPNMFCYPWFPLGFVLFERRGV